MSSWAGKVRHWNGWGYAGEEPGPEAVERWRRSLGVLAGVRAEDYRSPVPLDGLRLPPARLELDGAGCLPGLQGFRGRLAATPYERALHAAGRSTGDLIRLRTGTNLRFPDLVAYPADEEDVLRLLEYAAARQVALIPTGGGSSVVGGIEPDVRASYNGVINVDLRDLRGVVAIDRASRRARVRAGTLGPDLEETLRSEGLAFRHYPQSYACSTVGGWIAARAGGHFATLYGKIETAVESLRVVTPRGRVETREVPQSASGPDGKAWFIGSEGALGVITEAVLRLQVPPARKRATGFRFAGFAEGLEAVRRIVQAGIYPPVLRLLDEYEAMVAFWGRAGMEPGAFLHLGFEVTEPDGERAVTVAWEEATRLCRAAGGREVPPAGVQAWREGFVQQPYWRDVMIDHGLVVDTLETATAWSRAAALREAVREALFRRMERWSAVAMVLCRVTHAYPDGCSLYFTFVLKPPRDAMWAAWRDVQQAGFEAFLAHGATLSHHHGTGRDFAPFFEREHGPGHVAALRALKAALDPAGVLNPGVFFPAGAA
ncbi:FAD-binding oxidoreductase [Thermaerobacter subterraneus]|uniref:FAD/FMN-dependent dehydrogenase n=1 Tax=Thermaerobacter subterraneus DSM 13965 TaxID=867903 RepID=K6Q2S0_9FIRM|nr:FAD-binding oxidoreductase [Thermaerobacter subterraneus]EKP95493.1 FAD/FMN-dependent dehydrogenase [Thermaerobacter subterraneus DSM 13965]